jgi:hypothetical protein
MFVDPVRLKKMDPSLRNERTVPVHGRTGKKREYSKVILRGYVQHLPVFVD